MSWSAELVVRAGEAEPRDGEVTLVNVDEVPEHLEQYREAVVTAFGLLLSGVVGSNKMDYKIRLAGHGNDAHEPKDGNGNDWLLIEVTQLGARS